MAMNESNRLQNKKMINVEYQHIEEKPMSMFSMSCYVNYVDQKCNTNITTPA